MLTDKKNILILFLGCMVVFFAYFSYSQNETIRVMNEEITDQADHAQKILLEKFSEKKKVDSLSIELIELKSTLKQSKLILKNQE